MGLYNTKTKRGSVHACRALSCPPGTFSPGTGVDNDKADNCVACRPPDVTRVSGCAPSAISGDARAVRDCPTDGRRENITVHVVDPMANVTSGSALFVTVGGSECACTRVHANASTGVSVLACALPDGKGVGHAVKVASSACAGKHGGAGTLSYGEPAVRAVAGCADAGNSTADCPTDGNVTITLTGDNFGAGGAVVLMGGQTCGGVRHAPGARAHTELRCVLPAGVGEGHKVRVFQGSQISPLNRRASVSYTLCPRGTFTSGSACEDCTAGQVTLIAGSPSCSGCLAGQYANAPTRGTACLVCPRVPGVACNDGLIEAQDGYWSPAVMLDDTDAAAAEPFSDRTSVFACLTAAACVGNDGAALLPSTAFNCTRGHRGSLCAVCDRGYHFSKNGCQKCEEFKLSDGAIAVIVVLVLVLALLLGLQSAVRRRAAELKATLHTMRRRLHLRQKQQDAEDEAVPAPRRSSRVRRMAITVKTELNIHVIRAAHAFIKQTRRSKKMFTFAGESMRILFNCSKCISHLYSTLQYCLVWPSSLDKLFSMFNLLGLDIVAEAKVPCFVNDFSAYDMVTTLAILPLVVTALLGVVGVVHVCHAHRKHVAKHAHHRKHSALAETAALRLWHHAQAAAAMKQTEGPVHQKALWVAAPAVLFLLDLLYPLTTRTLLTFFSCRDLKEGGRWLESDYSVQPVTLLQHIVSA